MRELRSEIGGCGDGPGESLEVVRAAFKADTLLVFDAGRRRVVRLDTEGEELDRALPPIACARALFAHMAARDNRVLYTPGFAPRVRQAESLLLIEPSRAGVPVRWLRVHTLQASKYGLVTGPIAPGLPAHPGDDQRTRGGPRTVTHCATTPGFSPLHHVHLPAHRMKGTASDPSRYRG